MSETNLRQLDIADPEELNVLIPSTTIIGSGGIGSITAIALLKMGLVNVTVWDDDDLEEHNLGNQFLPHNLKENFLLRKKVNALYALAHSLMAYDSLAEKVKALWIKPEKFTDVSPTSYLVISGVDSMKARKAIWDRIKGNCRWYIDGRMSAQQLMVYTIDMEDPDAVAYYETTLYSDDEAMTEPCTGRGIIYTSLFAGAHIANMVKRIVFGPTPPKGLVHIIEHDIVGVMQR